MSDRWKSFSQLFISLSRHRYFFPAAAFVSLVVFASILYRDIGQCGLHHDDVITFAMWNTRKSTYEYLTREWGVHFSPMGRLHAAILHELFGYNYPIIYYFLLGLLLADAGLIWRLLRVLGCGHTAGFLAALLFVVHPSMNDSLFWITVSWALFQTLWGIISLLLMDFFLKTKSYAVYCTAILCFICAIETTEFGQIFLAFLFFLISIRIKSAFKETIASLFILLGVILIEYMALLLLGIVMNYMLTLMTTLVCVAGLIINKFVLYDQQKNYIKKAFMQYLSPEVVQELISNPEFLKLGGERREITAFFSYVAGFTSISEKLEPEEVVNLLNEYLTAMTNIILKYGGTVDKYEGDAIVAFFGAPIPHSDHAIRCCNAALDMQKNLIELREKWKKEGLPDINTRIGINTGLAVIGNMGSEQKMNYTMMGDTVNTASRLEGANKAYGTHTMISEFTFKELNEDFVVRKLDLIKVVGKAKPIEVYELIGKREDVMPETMEILTKYHAALNEYRNGNWDRAFILFGDIVKKYNDIPSKTYYERCLKYKRTPPPSDWDGVFILTSK